MREKYIDKKLTTSEFNIAIARIKEKIPLSQIVSRDVVLQKKGNEFVGNCPFHLEKTGSFFVNDNKGTYYCFGCGVSGDIFEYLIKKQGLQFIQAVEKLAEMAGVKLPEKHSQNHIAEEKIKILQKALEFFKETLRKTPAALQYCKEREIDSELIEKFSIGYAPSDSNALLSFLKKEFNINNILASDLFSQKENRLVSKFRDRLMFPVFNKKGWPIAFGGRGIKKDAIPKYLNSSESELFQKREVLYGYNFALKNVTNDNPFIIVEGYMDVVKMHKYGFNTSVASMGTALSSEHLVKLWKYSNEPIMCLDGDKAGYKAMIRVALLALNYLEPGKTLKFCILPDDDDPDSFFKKYNQSEMKKLLDSSDYLIDFIWDYFLKELDLLNKKTPEKIAEWKKQIYSHINKIQNTDIKSLYKNEISNRIQQLLKFKQPSNISNFSPQIVDKKEKILLREASLLYILIMYPSIVSSVVEELASVEFVNENFENFRNYIVENYDNIDYEIEKFKETIDVIKNTVERSYTHSNLDEKSALELWKNIFKIGVYKTLYEKELKIAKNECEGNMSSSNWDRLKALKLYSISKKK